MRSFGYEGYKPPKEFLSQSVLSPISFSSDSTLIASFLTREAVGTLPHRTQTTADLPLRLHAVFLNAVMGSLQAAREWSTPRPGVDIAATHDGQFIVVLPGRLILYSRGLDPLKGLRLVTPPGPGGVQSIEISPQGKSLLWAYLQGDTHFKWIDTDTLETVRSWDEALTSFSISDNLIAIYLVGTYVRGNGFLSELVLRNRAGASRTVCRSWRGCGDPRFVSNDVLALWEPHALSLIPAEGGDALFKWSFRQDEWIGPRLLRPSANGKRLAVAVTSHKGGSELLDIDYHAVLKRIMVFDIPSRQWIYTLDAKKQKIKTISGLALSPNGSLMAIMSNGVVEVYRLPPSPPGQEPAPQP